eukprot:scaffold15314_cov80-Attheya_sp.AAC.3
MDFEATVVIPGVFRLIPMQDCIAPFVQNSKSSKDSKIHSQNKNSQKTRAVTPRYQLAQKQPRISDAFLFWPDAY